MSKAKATVALFTTVGSAIAATLFLETSDKARAPIFGGKIAGTQVKGFLRNEGVEGKKPFVSFVDKDNNQIATANAVLTAKGTPILAGKVGEQDVWLHLRKEVPTALLERMGVNASQIGVAKAERQAA